MYAADRRTVTSVAGLVLAVPRAPTAWRSVARDGGGGGGVTWASRGAVLLVVVVVAVFTRVPTGVGNAGATLQRSARAHGATDRSRSPPQSTAYAFDISICTHRLAAICCCTRWY